MSVNLSFEIARRLDKRAIATNAYRGHDNDVYAMLTFTRGHLFCTFPGAIKCSSSDALLHAKRRQKTRSRSRRRSSTSVNLSAHSMRRKLHVAPEREPSTSTTKQRRTSYVVRTYVKLMPIGGTCTRCISYSLSMSDDSRVLKSRHFVVTCESPSKHPRSTVADGAALRCTSLSESTRAADDFRRGYSLLSLLVAPLRESFSRTNAIPPHIATDRGEAGRRGEGGRQRRRRQHAPKTLGRSRRRRRRRRHPRREFAGNSNCRAEGEREGRGEKDRKATD